MTTQTFTTRGGLKLAAQVSQRETALEISLQAPAMSRLVLHWGLRGQNSKGWSVPPQSAWPLGTVPAGKSAVQSPFAKANGQADLVIRLNSTTAWTALEFVLYFPDDGSWDNNAGKNYQILLAEPPAPAPTPLAGLRTWIASEEPVLESVFELAGGGQLATAVTRVGDRYRVRWVCDRGDRLILHWGIARRSPHALPARGLGLRRPRSRPRTSRPPLPWTPSLRRPALRP